MIDQKELCDAIANLAKIEAAGWLADLEHDIAAWCEPAIDPFHGVAIDRLARAASRILGEPIGRCRDAAYGALTPTRQKHALDLIEWYAAGAAEQEAAVSASDKLAKARRRAS